MIQQTITKEKRIIHRLIIEFDQDGSVLSTLDFAGIEGKLLERLRDHMTALIQHEQQQRKEKKAQ